MPSPGRTTTVGKYFVAYSIALREEEHAKDSRQSHQETSTPYRRKLLHLLYLLNELLHHNTHHTRQASPNRAITDGLFQTARDLIKSASAHKDSLSRVQRRKIEDLVSIWEEKAYFEHHECQVLRDASKNPSAEVSTSAAGALQDLKIDSTDSHDAPNRELPFLMPASHGDLSTPYYDLPVANMMPHIIPSSTMPIDPRSIKPLQFAPGPPDPRLVVAVQDLLASAGELDPLKISDLESGERDLDELGQVIMKSEYSLGISEGETYYGWSRDFCRNVKLAGSGNVRVERDKTSPQSKERSRSPRKRRRYSSSRNSYSRSRGHSYSRSRSASSDSATARPSQRNGQEKPSVNFLPPAESATTTGYDRRREDPSANGPARMAPLPPPFTQGFPLGPGGVPIPPRPTGYTGPWPPPPPPPPPTTTRPVEADTFSFPIMGQNNSTQGNPGYPQDPRLRHPYESGNPSHF